MQITYSSSVDNINDAGSSKFATAKMRIGYAGLNRKDTYITKETFEAAIPTMYNCPVVAHYMTDTNEIGGHDVGITKNSNGDINIVRLTEPVGCVPESATWSWEEVTEEDGTVREYLTTDILLWKRQQAYQKIKSDGVEGQSMEIDVLDYKREDEVTYINDMEFTAFCVLGEGVEPCFESASIELYSMSDIKEQIAEMMSDLKEYALSNASVATAFDDKHPQYNNSMEGGNSENMDEKLELLKEFGIEQDSLDFDINDFSVDELREKFEVIRSDKVIADVEDDDEAKESEETEPTDEPTGEPVVEPTDDTTTEPTEDPSGESSESDSGNDEPSNDEPSGEDGNGEDGDGSEEGDDEGDGGDEDGSEEYTLSGQLRDSLDRALCDVKFENSYGELEIRYWMIDYDADKNEVYAHDCTDYTLCGFSYSVNGDTVTIDFDSKKRMKWAIVEWVEGSADQAGELFSKLHQIDCDNTELRHENKELNEYKVQKEQEMFDAEKSKIFEAFSDLEGNEEFEALKTSDESSLELLETKCYAIRGKTVKVNFSMNTEKKNKLPVGGMGHEIAEQAYGGLFEKYGKQKITKD